MDTKIFSSLRKDFGAFAFLNLLMLINFFQGGVSTAEKYASIVHVLFGLISVYLIFAIGNLFPKNPNLIKGFVWFALLFVFVMAFWAPINIVWTIVFLIASIYLLIKLNKASKSLQTAIPQPPVAYS